MKKNRKKQYIVVTHVIKKENDQYVATCPEFDVSSFGETVEEANEKQMGGNMAVNDCK